MTEPRTLATESLLPLKDAIYVDRDGIRSDLRRESAKGEGNPQLYASFGSSLLRTSCLILPTEEGGEFDGRGGR